MLWLAYFYSISLIRALDIFNKTCRWEVEYADIVKVAKNSPIHPKVYTTVVENYRRIIFLWTISQTVNKLLPNKLLNFLNK